MREFLLKTGLETRSNQLGFQMCFHFLLQLDRYYSVYNLPKIIFWKIHFRSQYDSFCKNDILKNLMVHAILCDLTYCFRGTTKK